ELVLVLDLQHFVAAVIRYLNEVLVNVPYQGQLGDRTTAPPAADYTTIPDHHQTLMRFSRLPNAFLLRSVQQNNPGTHVKPVWRLLPRPEVKAVHARQRYKCFHVRSGQFVDDLVVNLDFVVCEPDTRGTGKVE